MPPSRRARHPRATSRSAAAARAAAALAAALATGPSPVAGQCCPPELIADHELGPIVPDPVQVASDDLGTVIVAYTDTGGVRSFLVSRDRGLTYAPPLTGLAEGARSATLAAVPDGTVVLAYLADSALHVRVSTDSARTFSDPVLAFPVADLGPGNGFDPEVELRTHPSGTTAVVVRTLAETLPLPRAEINLAASPDHGRTWGAPLSRRVIAGAAQRGLRTVAVSDSVAVHAYLVGGDLLTRRTTDFGQSWEPEILVRSDPGGDLGTAQVTHSGSGHVQAYFLSSPNEIRVTVSSDDGATWPGDESLLGGTCCAERPNVTARDGVVVATGWAPVSRIGMDVQVSRAHGVAGSWFPSPQTAAVGGVDPHHGRVALAPDGSLAIVHDDYRHRETCEPEAIGTCESIHVDRSCPDDGPWLLQELRLDRDVAGEHAHDEDPELSSDAGGRVHVAWMVYGELGVPPLLRVASLDVPGPPTPELALVTVPGEDCDGGWLAVEALPPPGQDCPAPEWAWRVDGAPAGDGGGRLALTPGAPPGLHDVVVTLTCNGVSPCSGEASLQVDVPEVRPLELVVEQLPPEACRPPTQRLSFDPAILDDCTVSVVEWLRDGEPLLDAGGPVLVVSALDTPVGLHDLEVVVTCEAPLACHRSESVTLDVQADATPPPADVGDALRPLGHGDPEAPTAVARFTWRGDEAAPRPADEHYHWLRGERPDALRLVVEHEPLTDVSVADATAAATAWPHVWFHAVVAADACERLSER